MYLQQLSRLLKVQWASWKWNLVSCLIRKMHIGPHTSLAIGHVLGHFLTRKKCEANASVTYLARIRISCGWKLRIHIIREIWTIRSRSDDWRFLGFELGLKQN